MALLLANMVADVFRISTTEARRAIRDGAVRVDDRVLTRNPKATISITKDGLWAILDTEGKMVHVKPVNPAKKGSGWIKILGS